MGSTTGTYTRPPQAAALYDEERRFVQVLLQAGKLVVDADWNDFQNSFYVALRRVIQNSVGDGAAGTAFESKEIDPSPEPNNFRVLGGDDSERGPEMFFLSGHPTKLFADETYLAGLEISPRSTSLTECELTDSAGFWVAGELVGRKLIPDITTPANTYTIVSNTQNIITVSGASTMTTDGATIGDNYRVTLSEPTNKDREDLVYLDVYLDEYDISDDSEIAHTITGPPVEAARRFKLIQNVFVRQGLDLADTYTWNGTTTILASAGPSDLKVGDRIQLNLDGQYFKVTSVIATTITISNPDGLIIPSGVGPTSKAGRLPEIYRGVIAPDKFIDADGNQHWMIGIASLKRELLNPFITDSMLTDLRRTIFTLDEIEDIFVNAAGDTMSGNLTFESGAMILGDLVLGFDQLKDQSVGTRHFKHDEHLLGDDNLAPDPLDLPAVHDNRYFRKSLISLFFGENKLVNPDFSKGVEPGWDNNVPLPIWGGPAEQVLENVQVRWMICGPGKCCHGIESQLSSEYFGCEIHTVCQEICVCGGGLYVFQQCFEVVAPLNVPEGFKVKPFLDVLAFSSCFFLGRERHYFGRTADVSGIPTIIDEEFIPNEGIATLRTLFSLPHVTDKIAIIIGYETIFEGDPTTCTTLSEPVSIITCKTALRKFADSGTIIDNEFLPSEEALGSAFANESVDDPGSSATIASCESKKVITPECVDDNGKVTYLPGWKQKQLSVYRTDDNQGDSLFVWDKDGNNAICPDLVETLCLDVCNELKTIVGAGSTSMRCFSLSPNNVESPLVGSNNFTINFSGVNFPLGIGDLTIIEEPAIADVDFLIDTIVVNPGGTTGSFNITISDNVTAGAYVIRFTDIPMAEFDDCILQVTKEASLIPCIYDLDCDVLPATNGIPYACQIIGANFEPGSTSIVSGSPFVTISPTGETSTTLDFDIIPNYVSGAGIFQKITIIVTTTGGNDTTELFIVDPAKEFDTSFTEGMTSPTFDGSVNITDIVVKFVDGNKPRLIIRGTNLDLYDRFLPIYAHTPPRGSDTISVLSIEMSGALNGLGQLPVPFVVEEGSYLVQHAEAIEIDLTPLISPSTGYMICGFVLENTAPAFISRAYTWGFENPMTVTTTKFVVNNDGTGFTVDGLFLSPGMFAKVNATLIGVGPQIIYVPVDTEDVLCATIQTKVPVDVGQPCTVALLSSPFGFNGAEILGHGWTLVGPGVSANAISGSVVCSVEPTTPVVTCVLPDCINQGTTLNIDVKGLGFKPGANLTFTPSTGITVNSSSVNAEGTNLSANVEFSGGTPLGSLNVTVTNPDLLNNTLVAAIEIKPPESAVPVLICQGVGGPVSGPDSMEVILNPSLDGVTDVQGQPPIFGFGATPFDVTAFRDNAGFLFFEFQWDGAIDFNIKFYFKDSAGTRAFYDFGQAVAHPVATWVLLQALITDFQTTAIDWTDIVCVGFVLTPAALPGVVSVKFDSIGVQTLAPAAQTFFDIFDPIVYPDQPTFALHWIDAGANHVINLGMPLSRDITPVITKCDTVLDFSYYGDIGWDLADVVLMPANENNIANPVVTWPSQPLGTDICLRYVSFRPDQIPERCCRNVMVESMYWTLSGCRAVEAEVRMFDVEDPQCACVPPGGFVQTISQMVSDPLMYRILPDDGFLNMPAGYGESITFEYRYVNDQNECQIVQLGSQLTPNQVYFAGGKRNDPNLPGGAPTHPVTGNPIYIVVHLGPGSPQGSRENLIAAPTPIPMGATSVTMQLSPSPAAIPEQIAVGMDVWITNLKDPRNGGVLCLTACDVLDNKTDLDIYGIYGTVTSYVQSTGIIDISWVTPTASASLFQPLWGGSVLSSPPDKMGFYWEASEGLLDFIGLSTGVVLTWEFRMWAGFGADCRTSLYSGLKECTDIEASVLLADGDGVERKFPFTGSTGNVLKERNWFDLFSTPTREQCVQLDVLPGSNIVKVIDATRFSVCDVIEIIDNTFTPGFRTSIAQIDLGLNQLILKDLIPTSRPGYVPVFDGFLLARSAKVFRLVSRVNCQICPTELQNLDGSPQNLTNQEMAVINFEAGTVTFDPNFEGCVTIWSGFKQHCYQLPLINGTYGFKSINSWNAMSEWAESISVRSEITSSGLGFDPTLFMRRDGTAGPTANIGWNGFKLNSLGPGAAGTDAVNKDQLDAVAALITAETDPLSIHLNGSNSPSANIPFATNIITGLGAGVALTDSINKGQLDAVAASIPSGLSEIDSGTYVGDGASGKIVPTAISAQIYAVMIQGEILIGIQTGGAPARVLVNVLGMTSAISTAGTGDSFEFWPGAITIGTTSFTIGASAPAPLPFGNIVGFSYSWTAWGV